MGFGAYRVDRGDPGHLAALRHALASGCTLIDTAPNYGDGRSELAIGAVLATVDRSGVRVLTKVGYVDGPSVGLLEGLVREGSVPADGIGKAPSGTAYCLHPAYLRAQIRASRERLGLDTIDGVLLHNPEYLLASLPGDGGIAGLHAAVGALREACAEGLVGSYGFSSNALAGSGAGGGAGAALRGWIDGLLEAGGHSGFRLVQFPFNLLERGPVAEDGGESLVSWAARHGLTTIANRPLNARSDQRLVRLADWSPDLGCDDEADADQAADELQAAIDDRLRALGMEERWGSFPAVALLCRSHGRIATTDDLHEVLHGHLDPFLLRLFAGEVPMPVRETCRRLGVGVRARIARGKSVV